MTADELRMVLRDELPALVRQAVRAAMAEASRLTGDERAVVDALGRVFGAGAMTTRDIVRVLNLEIGHRPALRQALQALVPDLDRQRIGMALRAIALRGGMGAEWRLQFADKHTGGRLWTLERTGKG